MLSPADILAPSLLPSISIKMNVERLRVFLELLFHDRNDPSLRHFAAPAFKYILEFSTPSIAPKLEDFKSNHTPGRKPTSARFYLGHGSEEFMGQKERVKGLTAVISATLELGLYDEANRVLELMFENINTPVTDYVLCWKQIPLFVHNLAKDLQKHSSDIPSALQGTFAKVATRLLELMSVTFCRVRPAAPTDWARRISKNCNCSDCDALHAFLRNPAEQVGRFKLGGEKRKHLERQLGWGYYIFDTEKDAIPYTLVITKTDKEHHELLNDWEGDFKALQAELRILENDYMKKSLGDRYDELVLLRGAVGTNGQSDRDAVDRDRRALSVVDSHDRNSRALPTVAGVKRKAGSEIINLCNDSSD